MARDNIYDLLSDIEDNEERFVLSRRRAAILIFFVGVIVLALLFIIRLDIDIKHGHIGERGNIIERVTPLLRGPVNTALNGVDGRSALSHPGTASEYEEYCPRRVAVLKNQRDPRMLLSSLLGSPYGRTDYLRQ
uniref:Wsv136-like protein n=1 Tax=Trachysalambria curvirostris nimavirus TaxID=2984282 RepID=A0A9C7EZ10_9VIRU|nr:MAG: wsv136-like protein [Trachysalambria curvirostris nimavirus]